METVKKFLFSHAGKGTAGVVVADLLTACPPALSWLTAGCLLCWAIGHFRMAFRSLHSGRLRTGESPVAVVLRAETVHDHSIHTGASQCLTHGSAMLPTR